MEWRERERERWLGKEGGGGREVEGWSGEREMGRDIEGKWKKIEKENENS